MEIRIGTLETQEEFEAAKLWRQKWSPLFQPCYGDMIKDIRDKNESTYSKDYTPFCYICWRIFSVGYSTHGRYQCPCIVHGVFTIRDLVSELVTQYEGVNK